MEQGLEFDPEVRRHLDIRDDRGSMGKEEDERPHHQGREVRRPGGDVIEEADELGGSQVDADLLERFTNGGLEQIGIAGAAPPSRQPHLARPRITGTLSPPNEQEGVRIGREQHRHCRAGERGILDRRRGPAP